MAKKPVKDDALSRLKAFYAFMTEHGLEALELDEPDCHVRLVRRSAAPAAVENGNYVPMPAPNYAALPAAAPHFQSPAAPPPGSASIKSSMMGIFYRASTPSSPPFVKEGDTAKTGQVLCMIEAMKVFNEIKAEFPCVVLKVLLENGKPVKAGQELFVVQRTNA